MTVGVIQASSQREKNPLLFRCARDAAQRHGHKAVNFGVFPEEQEGWTYVETALLAGLLLSSGAVEFIVTGCSSGQGMMLACNSLPGVVCGYLPTPQDAFLFGRINGGNAASLPLGLGFGWMGDINLQCTLDKLFDGGFGVGWPPEDAERKRKDTLLLKELNRAAKRDMEECLGRFPEALVRKVLGRESVMRYIKENGAGPVQALL